MSRWHGYVVPLVVIALSSFVAWCAWPPSRIAAAKPLVAFVAGTDAAHAHPSASQAVHHVQNGNRLFESGQIEEAAVEYHRANHAFPNHPEARFGLARVAVARGHYTRALELYGALLDDAPTPEVATKIGDILALGGDTRGARVMYAHAETLTRKSRGVPVRSVDNENRTRASAPSPETPAGR